MAEDMMGATENRARPAESRDAWAIDGFAPLPGDRVQLPTSAPDGGPERAAATVQSVFLCSESAGRDVVRWSWIALEDGRLLEIAPRGCALYEPPTALPHGSGRFLELAAQDGALVRFEERVRADEWQARPVRLTLQRRRWQLTATGTVTAQRLGPAPEGVWGQLRTGGGFAAATDLTVRAATPWQMGGALATDQSADAPTRDADLDVYFTLAGESDPTMLGLGVWMTDIALAFGRRLGETPAAVGLRVLTDGDGRSAAEAS